MACDGCGSSIKPYSASETSVMTFNQMLKEAAKAHPDLSESFAHILENLPETTMQAAYEGHRWYVNLNLPEGPVRVGNL